MVTPMIQLQIFACINPYMTFWSVENTWMLLNLNFMQTLNYGGLKIFHWFLSTKKILVSLWQLGSLVFLGLICFLPGPHTNNVDICKHHFGFSVCWSELGVLTSVGFPGPSHRRRNSDRLRVPPYLYKKICTQSRPVHPLMIPLVTRKYIL